MRETPKGRILWSESDCPLGCSCRLPIVVLEQSSQSLLTLNRSLITPHRLSLPRKQQVILFALMISFFMVMKFVLLKGSLQGRLAEENQLRKALLFDRLDPSFRKGVQIGTFGC